MSNVHTALPPVNNSSPITPTGETKYNARVDEAEWRTRQGHLGAADVRRVAEVHQRDLVFGRRGRKPSSLIKRGMQDSHAPAFAAFNGILHHSEDEFKFLGLATNAPEHQARNGPLGKQFAIYVDGSNTIVCRSALAIPKFAKLAWSLPRSPDLPIDGAGAGRMLAEIREYKAGESIVRPHQLHAMIARGTAPGGAKLSPADEKRHQFPLQLWEQLRAIGFTFVLAFLESDTDDEAPGRVDDREKLRIAEIFGMIDARGANRAQKSGSQMRAAKFARHALDAVFQMSNNARTGASAHNDSLGAFPLHPAGVQTTDQRTQEVARQQSGQVAGLLQGIINAFASEQERVIGFTPSGGFPGFNMDIVMRRQ